MWDLAGLLGGTAGTAEATLRPDVREWLATYDSQGWPSRVPVVEPTGRAGLDQLLRRVGAIAASMLGQCRSVSADRTDLRDRYFGQGERPRPLDETELSEVLARVDANNWLRQIVVLVETTADRARTDPAFDTSGLVREAAALLDSLPTTTVTTRTLQAALEEILSLPAWQLRHEVYAAWVLTQIVDTVNPKLCSLHPDKDGRLSFSYKGKGSHLATIHSSVHGPIAVWAELRTPLANPIGKGRTRNVQADYTLVAAPVTAAASARAVIECKQYQKASTTNFAHALTDYARAYPNAKVALVNYGPAGDRVLSTVEAQERPRCSIVERLRPDDRASRERFATWLSEALELEAPHPGPSGGEQRPDAEWATIRLDWSDHPRDLDLSVVLHEEKTMVVDFTRPSVGEPPLAWLDRDVTEGRGPETITITRPVDQVDVIVTRYSSDGSLASSGVAVTIQTPKVHVVVHHLGPDRPQWSVAEIFEDGTVVVEAVVPDAVASS